MALVGLLEDNDRIAKLCATFLHYAGHQVTIYDTSLNCLQALFSHGIAQDSLRSLCETAAAHSLAGGALLLGPSLPAIYGIQVPGYLTSHPHPRALPLIISTAPTVSRH